MNLIFLDRIRIGSKIFFFFFYLNKIIDDLYEGYIEKMTELDIEYENSLFSAEEELDTDIQKSKKELKRVLKREIKEEKE